ncbi:HAMP domain-containing sensor histidine kinase [Nonomuraea candida]|uniref:HAMP domain-containing sensor histidine kinase n=1 Tax=Nonomuraea candida TaxID=359159 RepID=UPI0005BE4B1C|nr:HAMP domain-containing sensor histidine kinase [Nonomuraea candida]
MTLRSRLALLVCGAMAFTVLLASVAAWVLIDRSLRGDIDARLLERVPTIEQLARTAKAQRAVTAPGPLTALENEPIGLQLFDRDGQALVQIPPGDVPLVIAEEERKLLTDGGRPALHTVRVDSHAYRIMTVALGTGGMVRLLQPLEHVERTMALVAWLLVGVAGVAIVVVAGLGWWTTRAGLRPVTSLADAAEQVARTKDLGRRLDVPGPERDELTRLAGALNEMLAALDEARAQQRHLVEDAAHELRTPLATLRNDVSLLLRVEQAGRPLALEERLQLLDAIESETAALGELVGELVDLARGESEPERWSETELRALVEAAVERTRRVNPAIAVTVRGAAMERRVKPASLGRAVANLVRNAIQVSPDRGCVQVEVAQDGTDAVITVMDRGPGIAAHEQRRIFDRFYRGEVSRHRHGSGLGLAIVAQAVQAHRGEVTVDNRRGGGARFTIRRNSDGGDRGASTPSTVRPPLPQPRRARDDRIEAAGTVPPCRTRRCRPALIRHPQVARIAVTPPGKRKQHETDNGQAWNRHADRLSELLHLDRNRECRGPGRYLRGA